MTKAKQALLTVGFLILVGVIFFTLTQNPTSISDSVSSPNLPEIHIIPVGEKLQVLGINENTELTVHNVSQENGETTAQIGIRINGNLTTVQTVKDGDYLDFIELKERIQVQKVSLNKGNTKSFVEIAITKQ